MEKYIRDLMEALYEFDIDDIDENTTLADGLGLDELDLCDICMHVEERYGVEISGDDLCDIETFGELINYFREMEEKSDEC